MIAFDIARIIKYSITTMASAIFLASGVTSATNLGGISVYNACVNQYPAAYHHEVFILENQYNVMGWRCRLNHIHSGYVELDLNRQCRVQYGTAASARYTDFNDPFSWYCEG